MVRRLYGDSLAWSNEGNRNEKRSDEGLRVWKRLRLQGRMPVQSMRLQALQLLNGALCTQE
jgi:hypothetical protein